MYAWLVLMVPYSYPGPELTETKELEDVVVLLPSFLLAAT